MHVLPAKHSCAWLPKKVWLSDRQAHGQTDRQTQDKVIPMCRYASQGTQKHLSLFMSPYFCQDAAITCTNLLDFICRVINFLFYKPFTWNIICKDLFSCLYSLKHLCKNKVLLNSTHKLESSQEIVGRCPVVLSLVHQNIGTRLVVLACSECLKMITSKVTLMTD